MDKTIKINLAGTLFQIDEESYNMLRDYLQAINSRFRNVPGGNETIDDIEFRIAEIFQSQKGLTGVITKENVEAMISTIGKPEDFDQYEPAPETQSYSSHRKRMYRNPDDTIISGVCGGIGAYLNTDPVLFRILFVLFTFFFGVGFLIYIVLWIALPPARTDFQKRELFGDSYYAAWKQEGNKGTTISSESHPYNQGYYSTSRVGNAFNEIFRAIGKVCYIFLRILLIIIGISLVLTGFFSILAFIMVFVFKYPGTISTDGFDMNLFYFPDFLNYIVNPATTPWIIALTLIVLIIPMLALTYWGVKMIFWFKAKDGIFNLAAFVLWIVALAALAIILFNEGISFAETGKTSSQKILKNPADTLYIRTDKKVSALMFDKEFSVGNEGYTVFLNDTKKEIYIRPRLNFNNSDEKTIRVDVRKRSSGRSKTDALKRTEELLYNYDVNGDTLILDEYFTIPSGRKWSADNVGINLYIPEGTILKFDTASENLLRKHYFYGEEDNSDFTDRKSGNRMWVFTEGSIRPVSKNSVKQK